MHGWHSFHHNEAQASYPGPAQSNTTAATRTESCVEVGVGGGGHPCARLVLMTTDAALRLLQNSAIVVLQHDTERRGFLVCSGRPLCTVLQPPPPPRPPRRALHKRTATQLHRAQGHRGQDQPIKTATIRCTRQEPERWRCRGMLLPLDKARLHDAGISTTSDRDNMNATILGKKKAGDVRRRSWQSAQAKHTNSPRALLMYSSAFIHAPPTPDHMPFRNPPGSLPCPRG